MSSAVIVFLMLFLTLTSARPNFVFFLTDDQDFLLNGMTPLKNVESLIGKNGVQFTNMFVTTPLCCPSRASILTGKYAHHHGVVNNSVSGNCNSDLWKTKEEPYTFVSHLKAAGYSTFHAGKYLNEYGMPSTGGVKHIPVGWDQWITLVGNSQYYNYSLSVNGKLVHHSDDYEKDYLTDIIIKEGAKFLLNQNESQPFFMFLSFPAPHSPFIAAPQYQNSFAKVKAPRIPNFNIPGGKLKHWLLRQPPSPLPQYVVNTIDEVYKKRWQTLLSVDDGVKTVLNILKKKKMLDKTYIFFTSDNGFHLGQFSLPWDKRQPYEFDVRVPLLVRGPNIYPGRKLQNPVLNIDIAPTILDLAKLPIPQQMDGNSFAPVLQLHSEAMTNRTSFIIEHQGEASAEKILSCPQYRAQEVHTCEIDCICEDSWNNTYTCIRQLSTAENSVACFFKYENFTEFYDINKDPYQLHNLIFSKLSFNLKSRLKLKKILLL